ARTPVYVCQGRQHTIFLGGPVECRVTGAWRGVVSERLSLTDRGHGTMLGRIPWGTVLDHRPLSRRPAPAAGCVRLAVDRRSPGPGDLFAQALRGAARVDRALGDVPPRHRGPGRPARLLVQGRPARVR